MGPQSSDAYHHLIEATRLAFSDAYQYVADPRKASVPTSDLISKDYADVRRSLIDPTKAMKTVPYGKPFGGSDTVYISCVDGAGNACSFINSVFNNFGSGLVAPDTGVVLQNRGALFSLDKSHPNILEPGKRPFHTIIPAMATIGEELYLCYGVMGGFMQPQGHLQVISNMVDFDMDPQESLNALRFMVMGDAVVLEEGLSPTVINDLQNRGHDIRFADGYTRVGMGGGQVIMRDPHSGVLSGGSEPRKDGCAIGW